MAEQPHPWDRRTAETARAFAAFRVYCELGAHRSVRESWRQNSGETAVSGTLRTWEAWSSKNAWVSRASARDAWLAQVSDEQIVSNIKACLLALTETALTILKTGDSRDFLRAARALSLHFPPVQRVEDVSERIEDLSDVPDEELERMREIRDAARLQNAKGQDEKRRLQ